MLRKKEQVKNFCVIHFLTINVEIKRGNGEKLSNLFNNKNSKYPDVENSLHRTIFRTNQQNQTNKSIK